MIAENTKITCPDCGGAIEKLHDEGLVLYRCRVGHAYSPDSVLVTHAEREENMLWSAVVILREGADLAEETAALPSTAAPQQLRDIAKAKRELSERVQEIVLHLNSLAGKTVSE